MSVTTTIRPRPATHSEQMAWAKDSHERQLNELRKQAGKRFWEIYFDEGLGWYGVRDQVGRILKEPRPLSEIRGFFGGLPPQA
jgi:hypothetical protein